MRSLYALGRNIIAAGSFLGCLLAIVPPLRADNLTLKPVADTFINSARAANNAGATPWIDAGSDGAAETGLRRALLRFDVSAIPQGSVITSAVLRLTVVQVPAFGAVDSAFTLHRLLSDWGEGNKSGKNGDAATAGEANWNARRFDDVDWSSPGAIADASTTVSASAAVGAAANGVYSWTGADLAQDIQFWMGNPSQNFGWLLRSDAENSPRSVRGFASREDSARAGTLEIGFAPPPIRAAPVITGPKLAPQPFTASTMVVPKGLLTLGWVGEPGGRFDLLFSTEPGTKSGWRLAQANIPGSASGTNTYSDPPYLASPSYGGNSNAFYRIVALPAPETNLGLGLQLAASNLVSPLVLTHAGDNSGRRFIADQPGQVWILDRDSVVRSTPFLDISNRMARLNAGYDERGLLGFAFHPGYATNGRFFVYYAAPAPSSAFNNQTVISEFRVSATDPNLADAATEQVLLRIPQPENNHEGGMLAFGPDGFLYIGTGDGGGAGDQHGPYGNAQVLTNLLGKILRIDVDSGSPYTMPPDNPFLATPGALPEIYAYGMRNPWRFSFDRGGERQAFIADVGQNLWEEVNVLRKGANYGWRIMEGNHGYDPRLAGKLGVSILSLEFPIFEYRHGPLGISVVGGYVYRGNAYPELAGKYVFGDFSTSFQTRGGQIFYLSQTRPGIWEHFRFALTLPGEKLNRYLKAFGEDEDGELYALASSNPGPSGSTGEIWKLVKP